MTKQIKIKQKNKIMDFLASLGLLGLSDANLIGNLLTGKGVKQSNIPGRGVMRAGEDTIKAGEV